MSENKNEIRKRIYADLRSQIFKGEFKQGDRLVETQIADRYQVNKAHVREVLKELEGQGLVRHIPMKGFVASGISREDLLEIAKIRELLESAIFEDFLAHAAEDDIQEVMQLTRRKIVFLQAGLKADAHKETVATFEKIYSCTAYRRMAIMLQELRDYINLMIQLAFDLPDDTEKTIRNSQLLYELLETRDYELCKKWIHIRYTNLVEKITANEKFNNNLKKPRKEKDRHHEAGNVSN